MSESELSYSSTCYPCKRVIKQVDRSTQDALEIWQAGVDAVRADRVLRKSLHWDGHTLRVNHASIDLSHARRLIVVGAGKAGGGMLRGLLDVLHSESHRGAKPVEITGWINVPQGAIPDPLLIESHQGLGTYTIGGVSICQARPTGVNEPTQRVLEGTQEILRLVEQAGPEDVVIFLLSGGGSALLSAPHEWLTLETKIAITRAMSSRGAGIQQLNAVRRALSQVKGGGLLRRCKAGKLITLVISDVLGDPLEMIGSGPTVRDPAPDPLLAARLLEQFSSGEFAQVVSKLIEVGSMIPAAKRTSSDSLAENGETSAELFVLANNHTAVQAACDHAVGLGYRVESESRVAGEGSAQQMGVELANRFTELSSRSVWISGGEPTVVLADAAIRGQGGRNQHLVLSAARAMLNDPKLAGLRRSLEEGRVSMALVSGGTDGEDGTTQAAGAWIDRQWLSDQAKNIGEIEDAIDRCDSHRIFERTGSLIQTGPTHTNVCDLRVLLRGQDS